MHRRTVSDLCCMDLKNTTAEGEGQSIYVLPAVLMLLLQLVQVVQGSWFKQSISWTAFLCKKHQYRLMAPVNLVQEYICIILIGRTVVLGTVTSNMPVAYTSRYAFLLRKVCLNATIFT